MKKLLLSASLSGLLLLGACGIEKNKAESQDKKPESVEKTDESPEQETNEQTSEQEKHTDDINFAKPINEMTKEEYDTYLLTQKRSYLTKEQQERYDYLLEMKGSSPGENDEKNKAYNKQQTEALEGNKGGTALITPPETEEEKEELRKIQSEQVKQRQAESNNSEQSQQ